jgi:LmbE family N-acetylglucosaminyl deacetylase
MASAPKTILAIGAHYDDCVFGIPGILLQAVQKGHRVVALSLIGDYTNWPPAKGREAELKEVTTSLAHYLGIDMRFLNYASGRFHLNEEAKKAVAQVVADMQPDIAFMLWHHDRHPDHEAASEISKAALKLAARILDDPKVKVPGQIYLYDNGPGHTIGFEPNTYVDVSDVWPTAVEWLGQLMAFVRAKPYDELSPDPAVLSKTALARYRGAACGARYAEAVWAMQTKSTQIF